MAQESTDDAPRLGARADRRIANPSALAAAFALTFALAAAILLAALLALLAPAAHAQEPLAAGLAAALDSKDLEGAAVGISVIDLETGATLFERRAADPFILASNTKLWTTAAAIERLGPGHRIETTLFRRGILDAHTLHGDLVLRGGGDPTWGARFFGDASGPCERLARAVEASGVRIVTGDLVLDERLFDRQHQHPGWPQDQLDRWYAAPVAALSLNDGCVDVTVWPGARAGDAPRVALAPMCGILQTEVSISTTGVAKDHVVAIGRRPGGNAYVVRGAILAGANPLTSSVAQFEPALVLGHVLAERLRARGIEVRGQVRLAHDKDPEPQEGGTTRALAVHATLTAELLPVINKRSQNHYAEMLSKRMGAVCAGEGSFAGGARVAVAFGEGLGIPARELELTDGSGLARGNRASPRAMTRMLQALASHRDAPVFLASLPVGGVDGTLEGRLKGVEGAARVRAKTGTIRGVSALSGYIVPAAEGDRFLAFSFLMNDLRQGTAGARKAQDRAVAALLAASAAVSRR